MIVAVVLLATVAAALAVARPWEDVPPTMRGAQLDDARSLSIDFGIVTDPDTDWGAVDDRLDQVDATMVDLSAGRVEFTAFDWAAHPDAAAEPGADHLARAARALRETADGRQRDFGLIVDAYVPNMIAADPSIAGAEESGYRSDYQASAYQLARGEVGDRLVDYVAALGERYFPAQIAVTELFLDHTSGRQDLQLFRDMTGATDWPRTTDGWVDHDDPALLQWRAEVIAGLLGRMREALDDVRDGEGTGIVLAMDVRVDWEDPAAGAVASGHDYAVLLEAADRLVVWSYPFSEHEPADIRALTAALAAGGLDMSRLTMSVGLWAQTSVSDEAISATLFGRSVEAARTHGVRSVNVTPLSLMDDARWRALARAWAPRAADQG